jgi:antirestriction protein ArdC
MTKSSSLYDTITATIIRAVEANPESPTMPWHRTSGSPLTMPLNAATKNSYRGINTLWILAEERGYQQPIWATYRQWASLGYQVRKGEKAAPVVFFKEFDVTPTSDDPEDDGKRRVARSSAVFNCAQVDGAP